MQVTISIKTEWLKKIKYGGNFSWSVQSKMNLVTDSVICKVDALN